MKKVPMTMWQSAVELQRCLDSFEYRFCFIGGIALQRWGEPRLTEDLDLTVVVPFGAERPIVEKILSRFQSRHPDPYAFATQARILLLKDAAGVEIDLSIGGLPFEVRMIERASLWGVPGSGTIRTCSAEDLVTLKSFAARPQDWLDVAKILVRQGSKLDRKLVLTELSPLAELKEEPEIVVQLERLFTEHCP